MHQRQDVNRVLADPKTDPELARQLQLARSVLEFASSTLQLHAAGSYEKVLISGQPAISWNVIAAPEFPVEARLWCFPVAGCVPYRGYFDPAKAEDFASKMRQEDMDVLISPATAYSTLGWFDDPLLDTMFQYSDTQLAAVLIHELAHKKLYIAGDTAFSESFAEFVESNGLKLWLEHRGELKELQEWKHRQQAEPMFDTLLMSTRVSLSELYASSIEKTEMRALKQALFDRMQQQYVKLVEQDCKGQDYFAGWMRGDMNNARLALAESYSGGSCAFAELYRQAEENMDTFYELAREKSRLSQELRQTRRWSFI